MAFNTRLPLSFSQMLDKYSKEKAVSPKYGVISVGKGNDYHHPHQVTLDKLNRANVDMLRMDEKGDIVISTDGNDISVKSSR